MHLCDLLDPTSPLETLSDQPVESHSDTTIYKGSPYFLRVDILCGSKELSSQAVEAHFTDLIPTVAVTIQEPVHPSRLKPQRLEIVLTTAPLVDSVPRESDICQMSWYAPMPILNGSVVYRVKVASSGLGRNLPEKSFAVNVNGFVRTAERGKEEISIGLEMPVLEDVLAVGSPSGPLWSVVERTPVLILPGIPGYKAVLMTSTEFQHTSLIEVGIQSSWSDSPECPHVDFSSMIQEAISTESSLFIRHNQLLYRFVGNYSLLPLTVPPSGSWQQLLGSVCVSRLVPVFLPHEGRELFYVLAGGRQQGRLYRAHIYDGDVSFTELLDSKGRTACEFIQRETCRVTGATHHPLHELTDLVLVELLPKPNLTRSYQLLLLDNGDTFTMVTGLEEQTAVPLELRGLVFNPNTNTLYIWGNTLLCSQDAGESYLVFAGFPPDQTIKYFTLSFYGEFAFVTETEELWWGQEAMEKVVRVHPSAALKAPSSSGSDSLLTVFYDWDRKLQEVVYHLDANGKGRIVKRLVPVAEILSYSHFSSSPPTVPHHESISAFSFPQTCPFDWEVLVDLPHPEPYSRLLRYTARPPLVHRSSGLHSTSSLASYQDLLHHFLLRQYTMAIGDPAQNPVQRFQKHHVEDVDYSVLMESNEDSLDFSVETDSFTRPDTNSDTVLPDQVYLDRQTSFSFTVYIAIDPARLSVNKKNRELSDIERIWLSAEVSNHHYLSVSLTRTEFLNRGAVAYKVTVTDRGLYPGQAFPGEQLLPHSLLLQVARSEMQCFQQTSDGMAFKGHYRLPIYVGCPPGKWLAFDVTSTQREVTRFNRQYLNCYNPNAVFTCFFFGGVLLPHFLMQDAVSGKSRRFLGKYTFKVVGGGAHSRDNIRMYSPEEVLKYNSLEYRSHETLIWKVHHSTGSVNLTQDGHVIMQGLTSKIQWMCQRNSPCGNLEPQGDSDIHLYLVIEISNKGVDPSTYCEYKYRFTVIIRGLPVGELTESYCILIFLAIICGLSSASLVYFLLRSRNQTPHPAQ
ncbi:cation channel sperm-associated auxiliary subunit gamma-like [Centroberyx gerrardi]